MTRSIATLGRTSAIALLCAAALIDAGIHNDWGTRRPVLAVNAAAPGPNGHDNNKPATTTTAPRTTTTTTAPTTTTSTSAATTPTTTTPPTTTLPASVALTGTVRIATPCALGYVAESCFPANPGLVVWFGFATGAPPTIWYAAYPGLRAGGGSGGVSVWATGTACQAISSTCVPVHASEP